MTTHRETREQKAQRLLNHHQVDIVFSNPYCTQGHVVGDHDEYDTIIYPSGLFVCGCTWGRCHNATHDRCSHAIALKLQTERITP